nr:MFS transporter [Caldalkalibacillus mannanilyticus]
MTWQFAFWLSLIFIFLMVPVIVLFIKDQTEDNQKSTSLASSIKEHSPLEGAESISFKEKMLMAFASFRNPVLVVVMIGLFTCGFNMGTVDMHLIAMQQHTHIHGAVQSASLTVLGILEVSGAILFGFLLDRMSRTLALSWLYAVRVIAFIFLYFTVGINPILFAFLFGVSFLGAIPGGLLVAGEASTGNTARNISFLLIFHQFGAILGASLGGITFDLFESYYVLTLANLVLATLSSCAYYYAYLLSKRADVVSPLSEKA